MTGVQSPAEGRGLGHRIARMAGRDPSESHRGATPLELLFDLAFVIAFGQAGNQLSHVLAEGHIGTGIAAFAFAMFAIVWAWINFSWFASAYDTDDWLFRITTMVQMIGVLVLALGLPELFHSIDEGKHLDNRVVVAGYVIMRIALVVQWLRAARQDPDRRATALGYAVLVTAAQIGWVAIAIAAPHPVAALPFIIGLFLLELAAPVIAERRTGGTPWHPHHIAERYGLLTIIALGEGVFGTVASLSALVEVQGWSGEAIAVVVAGIGLTFGLWWSYFVMPSGAVLARHRRRAFVWGYGHMFVFSAIAATGAGLHVAAYQIEGVSHIGVLGATLAVAIPVLLFSLALFALYSYLMDEFDPFHVLLVAGSVLALAVAVWLAGIGVSMGTVLVIITLAPAVVIIGYETTGHHHQRDALRRVLA